MAVAAVVFLLCFDVNALVVVVVVLVLVIVLVLVLVVVWWFIIISF